MEPPRGRGKARFICAIVQNLRITPAWAGKRQRASTPTRCWTDHPRVGGEKTKSIHPYPVLDGSPPRGRGKADVLFSQFFARRITPAWAGKSPKRDTAVAVNGDHPRVGGEKHLSGTTDNRPQGSPPHGRGKDHTGDKAACLDRITPAWAGKSSRAPWAIFPARDHPRVGGEKFTAYAKIWNEWGSPPRGRGKAPHAVSCASWVWITPAWAGKRVRKPSCWLSVEDHPRVGGEKCVPVSWATGPAGSPPRRRGKALVPLGRGAAFRITPA